MQHVRNLKIFIKYIKTLPMEVIYLTHTLFKDRNRHFLLGTVNGFSKSILNMLKILQMDNCQCLTMYGTIRGIRQIIYQSEST